MSVHGAGDVQPRMPNLNFAAAQMVQNLVIAPVGANGKVDLYNSSGGIVQLIADVSGYYLEAIGAAATISTGYSHSCTVTTGGVKCWGLSMLSDGTTANSSVPVDVVGLGAGVRAVSAGLGYTCVVTSARAVKCWGNNARRTGRRDHHRLCCATWCGRLGSGVLAVPAGGFHSCAVTAAGPLTCWGHNPNG